jgi:ribonuclease PH
MLSSSAPGDVVAAKLAVERAIVPAANHIRNLIAASRFGRTHSIGRAIRRLFGYHRLPDPSMEQP